MMNTQIINIPSGTIYLSEKLKELPKNVIFDKGKTGCGGTTLAIDTNHNKENYVVAVPFISLAENKAKQFNGSVFAFTGKTSPTELTNYLSTHTIRKIMVTYDSLEKLIKYIKPSEYKLLVDEYHLLFAQYSFREAAVKNVLNNYSKFDSYTFMTATPLEQEFILDELKNIPTVKAEWVDNKEVNVESRQCEKNVKYTVIRVISKFLTGEYDGNAYIFVNSVDFIAEMVKACGLTNHNTRAIWSESSKKITGLTKGNVLDPPKKINFLTSACFEGVDIYDEEGVTVIVSDSTKSHTLVDISTSFRQIAGRIRNSKFSDTIYHIYTTTRYSNSLSYNEFQKEIEALVVDTKEYINEVNSMSEKSRKLYPRKHDNQYVYSENNLLYFDPNRVKLDLYNYKITHHLYKMRYTVSMATKESGFNVTEGFSNASKLDMPVIDDEVMEKNFKQVVEEIELLDARNKISTKKITAFEKYDFLENAINILGYDGIRALKYHTTNIQRKIERIRISSSTNDSHNKIIQLLNSKPGIQVGEFVPAADLKKILGEIYLEVGIPLTPKGSDINNFYNTEEGVRTIKGKRIKGYRLKSKKLIS